MNQELFEALNTVYTYQVVGQDNGVNTSWVFDNGTQKLGMKMAAIKPGALKKYKPAERVAQFFLFRVSDTGKTGGAPKTIFKPFQTVSTIANIIATQSAENRINAFVVRFPKEMDGEGLMGLMQRVANKVSPVKYEQKGFYHFDGLQFSYGLFVRQGKEIESFFGKEWSKYIVHKDVLEYAASFKLNTVKIEKMQQRAEAISGVVRALDAQNIRVGIPPKLDITTIAGGNDIPEDVAEFQMKNKTVYSKQKSISDVKPVDAEDTVVLKVDATRFVKDLPGVTVDLDADGNVDEFQQTWINDFSYKEITVQDIANGNALEFIENWVASGILNGYLTLSAAKGNDRKQQFANLVSDICARYVNVISSHAQAKYYTYGTKYINPKDSAIVNTYTSAKYREINGFLLNGEYGTGPTMLNKDRVKLLDEAFDRSGVRLPEGVVLYRGMRMTPTIAKQVVKGKVFHFRTFVSCSLRPNISLYAFGADISKTIQGRANTNTFMFSPEEKGNIKIRNLVSDEDISAELNNENATIQSINIAMIVNDAHKVPVIIPGDVSDFSSECEVVLSRGTTMKINDMIMVVERRFTDSNHFYGTMDMSVMGPEEVKLNEVYDGDHFMETGELKKMSFSSFMESKKTPKKTDSRNRIEFMNQALISRRNEERVYTAKEKEDLQRLRDKFGGELL